MSSLLLTPDAISPIPESPVPALCYDDHPFQTIRAVQRMHRFENGLITDLFSPEEDYRRRAITVLETIPMFQEYARYLDSFNGMRSWEILKTDQQPSDLMPLVTLLFCLFVKDAEIAFERAGDMDSLPKRIFDSSPFSQHTMQNKWTRKWQLSSVRGAVTWKEARQSLEDGQSSTSTLNLGSGQPPSSSPDTIDPWAEYLRAQSSNSAKKSHRFSTVSNIYAAARGLRYIRLAMCTSASCAKSHTTRMKANMSFNAWLRPCLPLDLRDTEGTQRPLAYLFPALLALVAPYMLLENTAHAAKGHGKGIATAESYYHAFTSNEIISLLIPRQSDVIQGTGIQLLRTIFKLSDAAMDFPEAIQDFIDHTSKAILPLVQEEGSYMQFIQNLDSSLDESLPVYLTAPVMHPSSNVHSLGPTNNRSGLGVSPGVLQHHHRILSTQPNIDVHPVGSSHAPLNAYHLPSQLIQPLGPETIADMQEFVLSLINMSIRQPSSDDNAITLRQTRASSDVDSLARDISVACIEEEPLKILNTVSPAEMFDHMVSPDDAMSVDADGEHVLDDGVSDAGYDELEDEEATVNRDIFTIDTMEVGKAYVKIGEVEGNPAYALFDCDLDATVPRLWRKTVSTLATGQQRAHLASCDTATYLEGPRRTKRKSPKRTQRRQAIEPVIDSETDSEPHRPAVAAPPRRETVSSLVYREPAYTLVPRRSNKPPAHIHAIDDTERQKWNYCIQFAAYSHTDPSAVQQEETFEFFDDPRQEDMPFFKALLHVSFSEMLRLHLEKAVEEGVRPDFLDRESTFTSPHLQTNPLGQVANQFPCGAVIGLGEWMTMDTLARISVFMTYSIKVVGTPDDEPFCFTDLGLNLHETRTACGKDSDSYLRHLNLKTFYDGDENSHDQCLNFLKNKITLNVPKDGAGPLDALSGRDTSESIHSSWSTANNDARSWCLIGSPGSITPPRCETGGYATWIRVIEGRKLCILMHNVDLMALNLGESPFNLDVLKQIMDANIGRSSWCQYFLLEPGNALYIQPGTLYATYNVEYCVAIGGHFLSMWTMRRSMISLVLESKWQHLLMNAADPAWTLTAFKIVDSITSLIADIRLSDLASGAKLQIWDDEGKPVPRVQFLQEDFPDTVNLAYLVCVVVYCPWLQQVNDSRFKYLRTAAFKQNYWLGLSSTGMLLKFLKTQWLFSFALAVAEKELRTAYTHLHSSDEEHPFGPFPETLWSQIAYWTKDADHKIASDSQVVRAEDAPTSRAERAKRRAAQRIAKIDANVIQQLLSSTSHAPDKEGADSSPQMPPSELHRDDAMDVQLESEASDSSLPEPPSQVPVDNAASKLHTGHALDVPRENDASDSSLSDPPSPVSSDATHHAGSNLEESNSSKISSGKHRADELVDQRSGEDGDGMDDAPHPKRRRLDHPIEL